MSKTILISTLGTRGEVQPAIALGVELRSIGHQAILCVPPNFKSWVESFGLGSVPIGPDMKMFVAANGNSKRVKPSKAMMQQMIRGSVVEQFKVTAEAMSGCDLVVTAGDLQCAGKSIAELRRIPHVHATYCAATLRSAQHTPPNLSMHVRSQDLPRWIKSALWRWSDRRWNSLYREAINTERAKLGLAPVDDVPRYIAGKNSLVAADPLLSPAQEIDGARPFQTGAWLLPDKRPLPDDVEKFLNAGEPPIYFGFGSMKRNDHLNRMLIVAARAVGRRAIVSKGWGGFDLNGDSSDAIVIGDVSHSSLFPRVAVVVHHGGAGTTTTAARSGRPQVIVPHLYDQYYWAHRVERLGLGVSAGRSTKLTIEKLAVALKHCLQPTVAEQAQTMATRIESNGARVAAERLAAMT